jgi:hypothetical protein
MSKKARKRTKRRDRRRAKMFGWRRQGKCGMGGRVGHGPGAAPEIVVTGSKAKKLRLKDRNRATIDEPSLGMRSSVSEIKNGDNV